MWVVTYVLSQDCVRDQLQTLSHNWLRKTPLSSHVDLFREETDPDPSLLLVMLHIDTALLPTAGIVMCDCIRIVTGVHLLLLS